MRKIQHQGLLATLATFSLTLGSVAAIAHHDPLVNDSATTATSVVAIQKSEGRLEGAELDIDTPLETEVIKYDESDMTRLALQSQGIDLEEQGRLREAQYTWKARHSGFIPTSGATLDWSQAAVYRSEQGFIVDVPLVEGLDLVSKVIFTWSDGTLHTQEVFAAMESTEQLHIYSWIDGETVVDTIVVNHEEDSTTVTAGKITTAKPAKGPNWSRFNRCLNSKGIGWGAVAVISVVCGAACAATAGAGCAACLFAQSGATGSIISYCLPQLWK